MVVALLAAMTVAAPDTDRVRVPDVDSAPPSLVATSVGAAGAEALTVSAPVLAARRAERGFERFTPRLPSVAAPLASALPPLRMPAPAGGGRSGLAGRRLSASLPDPSLVAPVPLLSDTVSQQRPVLIDYSDAYYTRLKIHKWASWAMLPLFGLEYYTGQDLYNKGLAAPDWERNLHGPVAATLAGLFVVNTVTGGLNLWEGRKDPDGRAWRTTHGLLMLLADAGFAAVGMTAPENETDSGVFTPGSSLGESGGNQRLHRQIAIGSMAVAMVSWVMMLPPFRKE